MEDQKWVGEERHPAEKWTEKGENSKGGRREMVREQGREEEKTKQVKGEVKQIGERGGQEAGRVEEKDKLGGGKQKKIALRNLNWKYSQELMSC